MGNTTGGSGGSSFFLNAALGKHPFQRSMVVTTSQCLLQITVSFVCEHGKRCICHVLCMLERACRVLLSSLEIGNPASKGATVSRETGFFSSLPRHKGAWPVIHLATYPLQGISIVFVLAQDGKAPWVQFLWAIGRGLNPRMDQIFVKLLIFPIFMPYHPSCPCIGHSPHLFALFFCLPTLVLLSRSPVCPPLALASLSSSPPALLLSCAFPASLAFLPLLLSALRSLPSFAHLSSQSPVAFSGKVWTEAALELRRSLQQNFATKCTVYME